MRRGNWMQTYTGKAYYPTDPRAEDVCIEDIAHSLSLICRFAGHCNRFYSVAEHSVYVSYMVPTEHALQGLLHDATEAYCQDIPRPLKVSLFEYQEIELRNRWAICEHFKLDFREPYEVKKADTEIIFSEHKALFPNAPKPWGLTEPEEPLVNIRALEPEEARYRFISRYTELTGVEVRCDEL